MQKFLLVLLYLCLVFGIYLSYSVGVALYTQEFELMELVADIGTILICIDLAVFIYTNKAKANVSLQDYAKQLEQPPSLFVNITRKLGHLGIMLIICSWVVPIING